MKQRKLLLIGWDVADWKVIDKLIEEDKMPHLQKLIESGIRGNIATLYPILSPMLWTSISSGKYPYKHGIHGFIEPDLEKGGVRPITVLDRKCKAIWNILSQSGLKSNVIGWWPSHPAEPINGMIVSDYINKGEPKSLEEEWKIQSGLVHPEKLKEYVADLRIHPLEIEGDMILPFIPNARELNERKDHRLRSVAKVLANCSTVHAIATGAMQLEPWDFMAVYYDAIDHFSHGFMRYHPPKLSWIKEEDFQNYKEVIEGAYRYHDMMLGTLLQIAGEETTVILMSDHGFHSDHLRPFSIPNEPAGPAAEHRQYGIFVAKGEGIRKDELIFGSQLLDIVPTILSLFDLPIGEDMDGRPLLDIYEQTPQIQWINSWEEVQGDAGLHSKDLKISAHEESEALQQLADLGYIEELNEDDSKNLDNAKRELDYNLARSCIFCQRYDQALLLLESLWERRPDEGRYGMRIFEIYYALNDSENARKVLLKILQLKRKHGRVAFEEFQISGILN